MTVTRMCALALRRSGVGIGLAAAMLQAVACTGMMAPTGMDQGTEGEAPDDGEGTDPDDSKEGGPGPAEDCPSEPMVRSPLRRLSVTEYRNTLADLLQLSPLPSFEISRDDGDMFDNQAAVLGPSPVLIDQYSQAAFSLGALIAKDPRKITGCAPASESEEADCGRTFVERFGLRAFRRPLSSAERDTAVAYLEKQRKDIDFAAAIELTVAAFLQSAPFLYRIEESASAPGEMVDSYELANRLSFALWGSMPDGALFESAQRDSLRTAEGRSKEVERMLAAPATGRMLVDFHRQIWEFDRHERVNIPQGAEKDGTLYPTWTPELAAAVREESDRFIELTVVEKKGGFRDLLTANETYVNAPLARLYGLPEPSSGWSKATLKPQERGGFFTQAMFLSSHAKSQNASPPLRGVAIFERVFCAHLPPPPENADISNPALGEGADKLTNRTLFEQRVAPATCNGCHRIFDPFGHALESYDGIGRYQTRDKGLPVDTRVTVKAGLDVDGEYAGASELYRAVADSPTARACYARHFVSFAAGATPEEGQTCRTKALAKTVGGAGGVLALVREAVLAPEFSHRVVKQ